LNISLKIINNTIYIDFTKKLVQEDFYPIFLIHLLCHKIRTAYTALWIEQFYYRIQFFSKKNLEYVINTLWENGYPINLIFDRIRDKIQNLIKKLKKFEQEVQKN